MNSTFGDPMDQPIQLPPFMSTVWFQIIILVLIIISLAGTVAMAAWICVKLFFLFKTPKRVRRREIMVDDTRTVNGDSNDGGEAMELQDNPRFLEAEEAEQLGLHSEYEEEEVDPELQYNEYYLAEMLGLSTEGLPVPPVAPRRPRLSERLGNRIFAIFHRRDGTTAVPTTSEGEEVEVDDDATINIPDEF